MKDQIELFEKIKEYGKRFRFSVFSVSYVTYEHEQSQYTAIVIKDMYTGLPVHWTDYADYVRYISDYERNIFATEPRSLYTIARFINFILIDKADKYQILRIEDLKVQMAQEFIYEYALTKTQSGCYPAEQSVKYCRACICQFCYLLCQQKTMRYVTKDQFIEMHIVTDYSKGQRMIPRYLLTISIMPRDRGFDGLMRDMPDKLVKRFVELAAIHDPEIVFAIVLQIRVGLREGEICNCRRRESNLGPGVLVTTEYGRCVAMEWDLSHEYPLRSDGVSVGLIKRERRQDVYGGYLDEVYTAYLRHLKLINHKPCEETYPLFLCRNMSKKTGKYMAMTKEGYRKRINRIFWKHVLPSCAQDPDSRLRDFFYAMTNRSWGAHAFRHYFTVDLVLQGCEQYELQHYRGDRSPNSAELYLRQKGQIRKLYEESVNRIGKMILEEGGNENADC